MHVSELSKATYTQSEITGDAETGTGPEFQDVQISAANLANGTLKQRFDPMAFPQKGIKYTGTGADGKAVPAPARTITEA